MRAISSAVAISSTVPVFRAPRFGKFPNTNQRFSSVSTRSFHSTHSVTAQFSSSRFSSSRFSSFSSTPSTSSRASGTSSYPLNTRTFTRRTEQNNSSNVAPIQKRFDEEYPRVIF